MEFQDTLPCDHYRTTETYNWDFGGRSRAYDVLKWSFWKTEKLLIFGLEGIVPGSILCLLGTYAHARGISLRQLLPVFILGALAAPGTDLGLTPLPCHLILWSVDSTTAWREREIFYVQVTQFPEICRAEWDCNKPLIVKVTGGMTSKSSKRFIWTAGPSGTKHNYIVAMGQTLLSGAPQVSLKLKNRFEADLNIHAELPERGAKFFWELRLLSDDRDIKGVKQAHKSSPQAINKLWPYCFYTPPLLF